MAYPIRWQMTQIGYLLTHSYLTTHSLTYLFRNDGGEEVEPEVWHELLANKTSEKILILDCRNDYESDMGSFQGSTYLNTSTFSETWSKLDELLEGKLFIY